MCGLNAGIDDVWSPHGDSTRADVSLQQKRAFSVHSAEFPTSLGNEGRVIFPAAKETSPSWRRFSSKTELTIPPSLAAQAADEAHTRAEASGYDRFEAHLTSGGDDRSLILEGTGTNKYHIRPQPVDPAHVFRGSCTGNPPTERGYAAAGELFWDVLSGLEGEDLDLALRDVFSEQRTRLTSLLRLPPGAEVVLCPSGSDAEYIPLAIARALKPKTRIANGITQLKEIGAGSAPAAVGKYFSTHAPLVGQIPDEMEYLAGFKGVNGTVIAARGNRGEVIDASKEMKEFEDHALANELYPIVHGVFGGKTGIRDSQMPSSLEGGEKSLGVVDACQARFSLDELHQWLDQDSLVLFTGSKFYQAPPFCGAVIIPSAIAEKLRKSPAPQPQEIFSSDGLGGFLTDKELSRCFKNWKPRLRKNDTNNVGLALRWQAGLAGMEAAASIPDSKQTEAVEEWAGAVTKMVEGQSALDPWCVERSIISIRVAKEGGWLNMSESRDLYRWMSMDVSAIIPDATEKEKITLSKAAYIGQPVDVSDSHAIVRIALGVESLLSFLKNKERTLEEDQLVVQKLAAIGRHFETLKKSGQ